MSSTEHPLTELLRTAIEGRGLNTPELHKLTDIPASSIRASFNRKKWRAEHVLKLAEHLGLSTRQIPRSKAGLLAMYPNEISRARAASETKSSARSAAVRTRSDREAQYLKMLDWVLTSRSVFFSVVTSRLEVDKMRLLRHDPSRASMHRLLEGGGTLNLVTCVSDADAPESDRCGTLPAAAYGLLSALAVIESDEQSSHATNPTPFERWADQVRIYIDDGITPPIYPWCLCPACRWVVGVRARAGPLATDDTALQSSTLTVHRAFVQVSYASLEADRRDDDDVIPVAKIVDEIFINQLCQSLREVIRRSTAWKPRTSLNTTKFRSGGSPLRRGDFLEEVKPHGS
jgi:hypothetical protein